MSNINNQLTQLVKNYKENSQQSEVEKVNIIDKLALEKSETLILLVEVKDIQR
jgi:hypothetical protein